MTTAERARHIAAASRHFPALGAIRERDLLDLVACELGHPAVLDDFQPIGNIRSKALPRRRLLHVLSGNVPQAALQSLVRGLLIGAHNHCKIPAGGLPELAAFRELLPAPLARSVEIAAALPEEWLRNADAVIAFASDETIAALRKRLRPSQVFVAHGHRISFGIVFEAPERKTPALAARDASLHDQLGCLSPHGFYVGGGAAREFAAALAEEMERFNLATPRAAIPPDAAGEIAHLRSSYTFRAANDNRVRIWCSAKSTAWTVVFEEEPQFAVSPLHRFVFVKPLPEDLAPHLALVRPHLGTVAVWPFREPYLARAADSGALRICELGRAQEPSLHWHQDGMQSLAPLVTWIDLG